MERAANRGATRTAEPATGSREAESLRLAPARAPSAWQRLCPLTQWRDPFVSRLEELLDEPETTALLAEQDRHERYPASVVARIQELGWRRLLIDDDVDSAVTPYHLCASNAVAARRNASVAITMGVSHLALLPIHLAATPAQRREVGRRIRDGALAALLLTELAHGSNLLRNQARAEPGRLDESGAFRPCGDDEAPTHFRVNGDKELINGGRQHALLVTCVRTRGFDAHDETSAVEPLRDRGSFGVLLIERGPGVSSLPRWHTLPARGADISGVRFRDAIVPAERCIGRPQGGFTLIRKTLILSRGGIAALASGCLSQARDLARAYAARRNVYGAPIARLGAIADHLLRLEALDLAAAAISLKATAFTNDRGLGAAHYTAIAKRMACRLAEEGVDEGRQILGGRALLQDLPYERLIRDVTLYGVFDGTSHVMLDEVSARLAQEATRADAEPSGDPDATIARMRDVYARPPTRLLDLLEAGSSPEILPLEIHLRALAASAPALPLAALAEAADALFALVRSLAADGTWKADQGLRLAAADTLATLETAAAVAELADPDVRRALGIEPLREPSPDVREPAPSHADDGRGDADLRVATTFAVGWLGERALASLRAIAQRAARPDGWLPGALEEAGSLSGLERRLLAPLAEARNAWLRSRSGDAT